MRGAAATGGPPRVPSFVSGGFHHPVRSQALGAHADAARAPVDDRADALEVGEPATRRLVVGVADSYNFV